MLHPIGTDRVQASLRVRSKRYVLAGLVPAIYATETGMPLQKEG